MNRPHIIIKVDTIKENKIITKAEFHAPRKNPKRLSLVTLKPILENFDESIFNQININEYMIDNPDVISHLFSKKISKKNKFLGAIAATATLFITLNMGVSNSNNKENPENVLSKTIKFENVTPSIPELPSMDTYYFDEVSTASPAKVEYVGQNYQASIDFYSKKFGLDSSLVKAIIAQENPYNVINNSSHGAKGITQIESVWWNKVIYAYDFDNNTTVSETINKSKLDDPDYAIMIGCMILNNYYHDLYNEFVVTNVLTPSECAIASLTAYNKGITAAKKLIRNHGIDYINHRSEIKGGDNLYTERILTYVDKSKIKFKHQNDDTIVINLEANYENAPKL